MSMEKWGKLSSQDKMRYRENAAKRINKCIGTANSLGINMATLGGGFATREQYQEAIKSLSK